MSTPLLSALRRSVVFQTFTDDDLGMFERLFSLKTYATRANILEENIEGMGLYVIVSGSVQILRETSPGEEKQIAILAAGECFGEMALFDEAPHSALVRTMETSNIGFVSKAVFDAWVMEHTALGLKMTTQLLKILALRLRQSNEQYVNMLAWSTNASQLK